MKHSSSKRTYRITAHNSAGKLLGMPFVFDPTLARSTFTNGPQVEINMQDISEAIKLLERKPMYSEAQYKVGDVIKVIEADPARPKLLGELATIKRVLKNVAQPVGNPFYYVIDFGKNVQGHDGDGLTPWGHCWALPEEFITKHIGPMPKKGGNMSALSTLAKRTFDADTKALVKIGLLDEGLRVNDPGLLLEMLVSINYKPLAEEAAKRLAEAEAESKE